MSPTLGPAGMGHTSLGGLYMKNTSGSAVRISVTDAQGTPRWHDYPPGHDARINDIYISGSWFPPVTIHLPVTATLISTGAVVAQASFEFALLSAYQSGGGIADDPTAHGKFLMPQLYGVEAQIVKAIQDEMIRSVNAWRP